jgi:hypothetical protein
MTRQATQSTDRLALCAGFRRRLNNRATYGDYPVVLEPVREPLEAVWPWNSVIVEDRHHIGDRGLHPCDERR